jgi:hypothetical protein
MNETAIFLDDFGVPVVAPGGATGKGILDAPDSVIADGLVLSTGYNLTCETSKFGNLKSGEMIRVSGALYQVREVRKLTDGVFCAIQLSKV